MSRARAEKGLDAKKSTLMLIGLILVPVAGLWAAATLWCLRTSHKCGVRCRADQARKEADCVRCCGCPASTVHQQTMFWNWFTHDSLVFVPKFWCCNIFDALNFIISFSHTTSWLPTCTAFV